MNRQDKWDNGNCLSRGIEWTQIYGRPGYTWNPTAGCLHGCTWRMPDGSVTQCYAKTIAERFPNVYSEGFAHHYWRPHTLEEPLTHKEPAGIFVGSMADLFGHWVSEGQIQAVMDVMRRADWHIFQTLSKYPSRLKTFTFPNNVWVGVSLPAGHLMTAEGAARGLTAYLQHMSAIQASIRFMSFEPLWFDVTPTFESWLIEQVEMPFEWAIIGAASNGPRVYQPEPAWVSNLVALLDDQAIPVFFKGNLLDNPAARPWRESFPAPVLTQQPIPTAPETMCGYQNSGDGNNAPRRERNV
jgi:protein gp37